MARGPRIEKLSACAKATYVPPPIFSQSGGAQPASGAGASAAFVENDIFIQIVTTKSGPPVKF